MNKLLITGGAGFIGSNFVYYMLEKHPDYRIVCIDSLTYAGNLSTLEKALQNENFRFVKADITDREAVDKLFSEENFTAVVNFAAESHVDRSIESPEVFLKTNILGTQVLMDMARKYGNMLRVGDCPGDVLTNRSQAINLRFTSGETAVHSDMIMWNKTDTVENAADKIMAIIRAEHAKTRRTITEYMKMVEDK